MYFNAYRSITMMLFDHLAGIKNPFGKKAQNRPVGTAYKTILVVIIFSFLFTIHHCFTFIIQKFGMVPMESPLMIRVLSITSIFYQFVIPTISMFLYIFLIAFHIHKSQKVSRFRLLAPPSLSGIQ